MKDLTEKDLQNFVKRATQDDISYVVTAFMKYHSINKFKSSVTFEGKKKNHYYYINAKKTKNNKEVLK